MTISWFFAESGKGEMVILFATSRLAQDFSWLLSIHKKGRPRMRCNPLPWVRRRASSLLPLQFTLYKSATYDSIYMERAAPD